MNRRTRQNKPGGPPSEPPPPPHLAGSIHRWQSRDGTYREIQRIFRHRGAALRHMPDSGVMRAASELSEAVYSGRTMDRLLAFRGVRDIDLALGPDLSLGARHTLAGFTASTLDAEVTAEFIPSRGVILALDVPARVPALDVGAYGDPAFAFQRELLLPDGITIEITGHDVGATYSTHDDLAGRMVINARVLDD